MLVAPCIGALAITVAAGASAATTPSTLANLPAWMGLASAQGASWAVLAGSGAISSGMVGYAKANTVLATPETLFEAASLSKVVLAVAVHDIVRGGRIDLDRPVAERVAFTDDGVTRSITPRYLLPHSSGLPNWFRLALGRERRHREPVRRGPRVARGGRGPHQRRRWARGSQWPDVSLASPNGPKVSLNLRPSA